jgi:hypothetical protein
MSGLRRALEAMVFARGYTVRLLDATPTAEWFRMPGGVTHVAWQVGHLAVAEYRIGLLRLRGRLPGDDALLDDEFIRRFGYGSTPHPDRATHPHPDDIRAVFDRVHVATLGEWPKWSDADLASPPLEPHPAAPTKLGALVWCGQHEMLHAGQIGLLRRQLGHPPVR